MKRFSPAIHDMLCRTVFTAFAFLAITLTCAGQEPRAVTQSYLAGIGSANVLDTYLSQEKYEGTGLTLLSLRELQRGDSRWTSLWQHQLHLAQTDNRAGNGAVLEATYNVLYGRYYRWPVWGNRLHLQAGGLLNLTAGAVYNTVGNANNPAQGRIALQLMPSGIATYGFRFLKRQWCVRYELDLPLAGVMFSPNYGQSYYEMFALGNYDHNVVPTTFVTSPCFRQLLTVQCDVTPTLTLSLGGLSDVQQARVNGLKQHVYNNSVVIGLVRHFSIVKR